MVEDEGLIGAFVEDKLVGYLRLLVLEEYGHLGQIAVEKTERGKGFGNELMDYAIEFYEVKEVNNIGLYVETKNNVAISLYEKYGFRKKFESFHYWINEEEHRKIVNQLDIQENCNVRVLELDDYETIVKTFPEINTKELRVNLAKRKSKGLSGGESIPLGLFVDNRLQVYGRFNPEFPGCRPFLVTEVKYVDEFIKGLEKYRKQDYIRLTFDRNKELAKFFEDRGYRLHHHLFLMERKMKEQKH
jgi:hypothetical protein